MDAYSSCSAAARHIHTTTMIPQPSGKMGGRFDAAMPSIAYVTVVHVRPGRADDGTGGAADELKRGCGTAKLDLIAYKYRCHTVWRG